MKKLLTILFILFSCAVGAQSLHVDSTRFVSGYRPTTAIKHSIPTADKGILFVGNEGNNPGGIIPYFPIDTVLTNVFIGKIDSNQKISWIKVYGGSQDDGAGYACQTPDGGYAVLAGTESSNGDVTGYRGGGDIWLLRIDANGNLLWEQTYGSTASDLPIAVANTPDGGFIISACTDGSDDEVPFHYGDYFSLDWLVIKTDSLGNLQWSKDLGGTSDEADNGSIFAIDNGYYLVSSSGSTDHDCTDTAWHPGVPLSVVIYILRLDTAGNVLWDSSYGGGTGGQVADAIFDKRDSTLILIGGVGANGYMATGYHYCQDEGDYWVLKVKKDGKLIWAKTLGSVQEENATGICIAPNGGYMAYGTTFPNYCHDTTIGDIGQEDCWLFLLDSAGNELANKVFGGVDAESPASIVPYLNGYAATGTSGSSTFTEGSCNVNYSGAFVSYIDSWPLSINTISTPVDNTMAVYPNPADDKINVIINCNKTGTIVVINTVGQEIYKQEITQQTSVIINVNQYAAGMYCLLWQGADGIVLTKKFIKN